MRIALISDIHEDSLALKKVLKRLKKTGYDRLVCLGDICGFSIPFYHYHKSRDAHDCLNRVREHCDLVVAGNHDLYLVRKTPRFSDIFAFPANWYELEPGERERLSANRLWLNENEEPDPGLTVEDLRYLESLPEYELLTEGSQTLVFSHYVYPNLSGFQKGFYHLPAEFHDHLRWMQTLGATCSFTGHGHPEGLYCVTPDRISPSGKKTRPIPAGPAVFGIPPVTRNHGKTGFAVADLSRGTVAVSRVFVPG